jgi:hypothetical protein
MVCEVDALFFQHDNGARTFVCNNYDTVQCRGFVQSPYPVHDKVKGIPVSAVVCKCHGAGAPQVRGRGVPVGSLARRVPQLHLHARTVIGGEHLYVKVHPNGCHAAPMGMRSFANETTDDVEFPGCFCANHVGLELTVKGLLFSACSCK